jgi:hypothetical protein
VHAGQREVELHGGLCDGKAEQERAEPADDLDVGREERRELVAKDRAQRPEDDGDPDREPRRAPAGAPGAAWILVAQGLAHQRGGGGRDAAAGNPREREDADPDGVDRDRDRAVVREHREVDQHGEIHHEPFDDAG